MPPLGQRLIEFLGVPEMEKKVLKIGHGGRRKGAGRPPSLDRPVRRTIYLDQRHIDQITRWQFEQGGTFSEALRAILDSIDPR